MLDPEFLAILCCPRCHSPLEDMDAELRCTNPKACGLKFPVEDGIPNLVIPSDQENCSS